MGAAGFWIAVVAIVVSLLGVVASWRAQQRLARIQLFELRLEMFKRLDRALPAAVAYALAQTSDEDVRAELLKRSREEVDALRDSMQEVDFLFGRDVYQAAELAYYRADHLVRSARRLHFTPVERATEGPMEIAKGMQPYGTDQELLKLMMVIEGEMMGPFPEHERKVAVYAGNDDESARMTFRSAFQRADAARHAIRDAVRPYLRPDRHLGAPTWQILREKVEPARRWWRQRKRRREVAQQRAQSKRNRDTKSKEADRTGGPKAERPASS